jgi:hypothetical protein
MTGGTEGGEQRASSVRPRCIGEVDPETMTHIYLSSPMIDFLCFLIFFLAKLPAAIFTHSLKETKVLFSL